MSAQEIQSATLQLPPTEQEKLLDWIHRLEEIAWDKQIAHDVQSCKFEVLRQGFREQRDSGLSHTF
jgi:hypothetical protein